MGKNPDNENCAFVQMVHSLSEFYYGKGDDVDIVAAAKKLLNVVDDKAMSQGTERGKLSFTVPGEYSRVQSGFANDTSKAAERVETDQNYNASNI